MIGTTIGQYRIEAEAGAGGMGLVYRATDVDLKRPAAVKVLSAIATGDPERRPPMWCMRREGSFSMQRGVVWLRVQHAREGLGGRLSPEGRPAGQHLVQDRTAGPDVRLDPDRLAARLFRTHIRGRSNHEARTRGIDCHRLGVCAVGVGQRLGDAEGARATR
jgi:serine/threonine protein kinase